MLGIPDPWIWLAYILCLVSAFICLAYGAATWNSGGEEPVEQQDMEWAKHEDELDNTL